MQQEILDQPFETFIPHRGDMVLLDKVLFWDDEGIVCLASSHTHKNNPLKIDSHLSIYAGVEYAAQAMAAHAWFIGSKRNSSSEGFIAAVHKVNAFVESLSGITGSIKIAVKVIDRLEQNSLYHFTLHENVPLQANIEPRMLLEGQLMVVAQ